MNISFVLSIFKRKIQLQYYGCDITNELYSASDLHEIITSTFRPAFSLTGVGKKKKW